MKAVSTKIVGYKADGKRIIEALLVADSVPSPLPTTGESVDGLDENDTFAPMSILYVVGNADSKVYVANESGEFIAQ